MQKHAVVILALVGLGLVACSGRHTEHRSTERPQAPEDHPERRAALETQDFSLDAFLNANALPFKQRLGYPAADAEGLDTIQDSDLALRGDEMIQLEQNGFVISERLNFMSFGTGYEQIYKNDLPVYISADSLLHAVHRSYDDILMSIERTSLIPELQSLLTGMRTSLADGHLSSMPQETRQDVDFYLAVALSLLNIDGAIAPPVAGADLGQITEIVALINQAGPPYAARLFGVDRTIDTSQFKPRGHYNDWELAPYFRSMMWLGRIDMRIVETKEGGIPVLNRRQLDAAFGLHSLMDATQYARWARIDATIGAFVGPHDSMSPDQLNRFLADLGPASYEALAALPDEKILGVMADGAYGQQRIASHIAFSTPGKPEKPRPATFLLLGQRYVVDSHVFSEVVYDRMQSPDHPPRMMPNALDVAYAALGNDAAAALLGAELERYGYAPALQAMRAQVDTATGEFWEGNLYNLWLGAIRGLSPRATEIQEPLAFGMPTVTGTEPWSRRILSAQLASWAELRHDTLLYAKQSYTMGILCEFPDAYVDPYPAFYAGLRRYAQRGGEVVSQLPTAPPDVVGYFERLANVSAMLEEMARHQRDGIPFTDEHMAFVNNAVRIKAQAAGCTTEYQPLGWYPELFYRIDSSIEYDPTIADVHTQPTDEAGVDVGRILHVGTGKPRMMVVTVDTCHNGVRAYAGLVSSYFEVVKENYQRMDDETWSGQLQQEGTPADVPWMMGVVR